MALIEKNIEFLPYKPMPPWRKLAVSTWRTSEEASFYGWMDIDASGIRAVNERFHQQGKRISPTAIAAKDVVTNGNGIQNASFTATGVMVLSTPSNSSYPDGTTKTGGANSYTTISISSPPQ